MYLMSLFYANKANKALITQLQCYWNSVRIQLIEVPNERNNFVYAHASGKKSLVC